ncbi:MAG TPA: hypothetical protein VF143_04910 [Candidatus Nanopelagicales bacterium]
MTYVTWQIQMSQLERSRRGHQQHLQRAHEAAASAALPPAPTWSDRIRAIVTLRMRPAAA